MLLHFLLNVQVSLLQETDWARCNFLTSSRDGFLGLEEFLFCSSIGV